MYYLRVDKTLKLPVYHQLKAGFEQAIHQGLLINGQQLPTEEEVCQCFDISHYIIRHAYDQLMDEGLICRIKGKGSFVTSRKVLTSSLTHLKSLEELVNRQGCEVSKHTQFIELIHDDPQAYIVLNLEVNETCLHVRRILLSDHQPLYLQDWYLPEKHFPKIRRQLMPDARWIEVINQIKPISTIQNLYSAKCATIAESQSLNIKLNDPVFVNRAHILDEHQQTIGFVVTIYPGDYTRLEVNS